jgi:hypothetical protein
MKMVNLSVCPVSDLAFNWFFYSIFKYQKLMNEK